MDSDAAGSGEAAGLLLLGVMAARARRPRGSRRSRSPWTRRGLAGLVLALGLAAGTRAHAAYGFRMDITLQRTQVGNSGTSTTTLSNYPLLLDITSANLKTTGNGGNVQNASGFDIIFVAEDATTCGGTAPCNLSFELESYTATTGHVIAWVNIPVLNTTSATSNQTIVVEYGNAAISTFQGGANGAAWNSNFKGVWHMTQAASIADSTTTGATATATGTNTSGAVTGLVNKAFSTTSTTGTGHLNYLNTAFNAAAAGTSTYEGWFKTTDSFGPLLSQRSSNGNSVIDIMLGYDGATTASAKIDVLVRDDNNTTYAEVTGTAGLNDGNWHQFAVTRNSGTITVYVDGAWVNSATNSGASSSITSDTSGAGYQSIGLEGDWVASAYTTAENEYLAAIFDEYRITNSAQSSDWIVTDYNTIKTPASTYVLGSQVATSCGNGSRTGTEACDDGNLVSGDGCSSSCTIETGYTCSGSLFAKSTCSTTCGDGITAGSEACDTGASNGTGGCSSSCTVVSGYHCTTASPSVCALATFAYTKTVYVDHTKVGTASAPTTLTNYPMLFSVTDTSLRTVANGGRVQNANGYDIIFRGADTTTCGGVSVCTLSHEVEKYDATTGQLIAWINIPGLKTQTNTAHTQFGILFGNTYITTSTERVTSTWNSAFSGVWHLNQNPGGTAPQMLDSTSNSNDGTNAGALTATGEVGTGVSTNGSSSYISFGSGASLNVGSGNDFTYSVWLNTSASYGGIFSLRSSTSGNPVVDIMVGFDGISTSAGALLALTRDDNGAGLGDVIEGSTSISNGAWHLVTVTRSGTTLQLYDNTTSAGTATVTSAAISSDTRDLGTEGRWVQDGVNSGKQYLAATYDELRVSTTARSLDWITTDYNSQSSPSTFIIYTTGTAGEVATTSHTEAAIVSLQATDNCPGTTVAWQTGYEVDALGFNVYRDLGGQRVRLNTSMLPARGLTAGGSGYSYQLVDDASADPSRTYWIEEVRLNLDTDLTGPVAPAPGPACATTPPMTLGPTGGAAGGPTPVVDTSPAGEADQMGGCAVAGGGPAWGLGPAAIVLLLAFWPRRARSLRKFSSRPQGE